MTARWTAAALAAAMTAGTLVTVLAGPGGPAGATASGGAVRPAVRVTRLPGLDGPADGATVSDINERGVAVGQSSPGDGPGHAVTWDRHGRITDLTPDLADTEIAEATALNDRGAVLGGTGSWLDGSVVLWEDGDATTVSEPGDIGRAVDVNERGQVLYGTLAGMFVLTGVVWEDGERIVAPFVPEADAPVMGFDINEHGLVAGGAGNGGLVAFSWRPGEAPVRLPLPPGGVGGMPAAVNDRGDIAGTAVVAGTPGSGYQAVRWRDGRPQLLGTLDGGTSQVGSAWEGAGASPINRHGDVVGSAATGDGAHAVLWRDGRTIDLGTLGGRYSEAFGINDRGQVVGRSETASGEYHAFAWQDGRMIDLTVLAGGGQSTSVTDINDRGQVVGNIGDGLGHTSAHRWDLPARL